MGRRQRACLTLLGLLLRPREVVQSWAVQADVGSDVLAPTHSQFTSNGTKHNEDHSHIQQRKKQKQRKKTHFWEHEKKETDRHRVCRQT